MSFFRENPPRDDLFSELEAFASGRSSTAWRVFGAHPARDKYGVSGCLFRTWAPNASSISVIGDFNNWDETACPMTALPNGVWEVFVPALARYDRYQFSVCGADGNTYGLRGPKAEQAAGDAGTITGRMGAEDAPGGRRPSGEEFF